MNQNKKEEGIPPPKTKEIENIQENKVSTTEKKNQEENEEKRSSNSSKKNNSPLKNKKNSPIKKRLEIKKKRKTLQFDYYQSLLNRYSLKFIKVLGTGSSGIVLLGKHLKGELFAVKVISKDFLRNKKLKEKLEREIAVSKLIKHKNLVQFKGVSQDELNVYLFLEYAEGGELFNVIKQKKLTEMEIFHYFSEISLAIEYLHSKLICHRDIKPENILLTRDGTVKITDFGMAALLGPDKLAKTSCGSPHYTAPEVISSATENYDGIKADIWSLGVVLYTLSTNSLPFGGGDTKELHLRTILKRVISGKFTFPSEFQNEDIKDLITKLLNKQPKERPSFKQIRKHRWWIKCVNTIKKSLTDVQIGKEIQKLPIQFHPTFLDVPIEEELVTEEEIQTEMGMSILKIFKTIGWKNEKLLINKLTCKKKNIETVIFRLLEKRINNNEQNGGLLFDEIFGIDIETRKRAGSGSGVFEKLDPEGKINAKNELIKAKKGKKEGGKGNGLKKFFGKLFNPNKKDNQSGADTLRNKYLIKSKILNQKQAIEFLQRTFLGLKIIYRYETDDQISIKSTHSEEPIEFTIDMKAMKTSEDNNLFITFSPKSKGNQYKYSLFFHSIQTDFEKQVELFNQKHSISP